MINDYKKVKEEVEYLVEKYEILRNNDTLLYLAILNRRHDLRCQIGHDAYDKLKDIMLAAPKFEGISRARRKAIEDKPEYNIEEEQKMRELFRNGGN